MFNSNKTYRAISLIIANGLLFSLAQAQNEEKAVLDNSEQAVVAKKNQKRDKETNQKSQTNNQEEISQEQQTEQENGREVVRPPIQINGENAYTSVSASDAVFLCETSTGKKAFVDRIKRKDYENCTQISGQPEEDTRAEIAQDTSVPPHLYSGEEYNMTTSEKELSIKENNTVRAQNTENNNNEDKPLISKITEHLKEKKTTLSEEKNSTVVACSGALIYKGSTYIFNEQEPCPIPEEVFKKRKPIEADPSYYTN